jgi:HEAT repeat protein
MKRFLAPLLLVLAAAPAFPQEGGMELEPLVITAPRLKISKRAMIDPQINATLLRLLRTRQDARPDSPALLDASVGNLVKLSTLEGYNLKTRYTELGFLLTEGLAGVTEYDLASELEKTVRLGTNVQTRAAAMVALAYTHDLRYVGLFQGMLADPNVTLRLGALESLMILGDPSVQFQIAGAARGDLSLPLQIYAAAGMWRAGDIYGREILLRYYQHQDWFVRAMAIHYLGELGGSDEYWKLLQQLGSETHPSVRAELTSALMRLQRFKD